MTYFSNMDDSSTLYVVVTPEQGQWKPVSPALPDLNLVVEVLHKLRDEYPNAKVAQSVRKWELSPVLSKFELDYIVANSSFKPDAGSGSNSAVGIYQTVKSTYL